MKDCKPISTPSGTAGNLSKSQCPETYADNADMAGTLYKELVESLMYATMETRPDLATTVGQVRPRWRIQGQLTFSDIYREPCIFALDTRGKRELCYLASVTQTGEVWETVRVHGCHRSHQRSNVAEEAVGGDGLEGGRTSGDQVNQGSLALIKTSRTKHIDIGHHFIRDAVAHETVTFKYCQTQDMIADLFFHKFQFCRKNSGLKMK